MTLGLGKFLYQANTSMKKAPNWVSCEIKVIDNGIERIATSKDGVIVWDSKEERIDLPPGIYKIEARIYGIPKEDLKNVKFIVLIEASYKIAKSALYDIKYSFKENIQRFENDFESLNCWDITHEYFGAVKIAKLFKNRSGVVLLNDSAIKYTGEISIKPT